MASARPLPWGNVGSGFLVVNCVAARAGALESGLVSDLFLSGRRWNSWNHFQCDGNGEVVIRETGASSLSLQFFLSS
jgi:hypothetical protein